MIRRFRLAALLLCIRALLPVAALVLLARAMLENDQQLAVIGILMGIFAILIFLFQCILANRALCPLCMTPVMASRSCSKHRNARTLLGSHRLRVAVAVLCKGSFYCPYCHEPSVLEVRPRNRMNYGSDSRS